MNNKMKKYLTTVAALMLAILAMSIFTYASENQDGMRVYWLDDEAYEEVMKQINYRPELSGENAEEGAVADTADTDTEATDAVSQEQARSNSTYGAALGYRSESSSAYNCYAYARELNTWLTPGDQAGNTVLSGSSVSTIAYRVIDDLRAAGLSARVLSGLSFYAVTRNLEFPWGGLYEHYICDWGL